MKRNLYSALCIIGEIMMFLGDLCRPIDSCNKPSGNTLILIFSKIWSDIKMVLQSCSAAFDENGKSHNASITSLILFSGIL
jgi:phage-related protein